jgi:hypothetical protein
MVDAEGNPVKALPPAKKARRKAKPKTDAPAAPTMEKVTVMIGGKMKTIERPVNATPFAPTAPAPTPAPPPPSVEETALAKPEPKPVVKVDPRFVKLNRELRDRYLEQLNAEPELLPMLGKYEPTRALPEISATVDVEPLRVESREVKALPKAA